jgi:hypothetical protein
MTLRSRNPFQISRFLIQKRRERLKDINGYSLFTLFLKFTFTHGSNFVIGKGAAFVIGTGSIATERPFVKEIAVVKTANKAIAIFVSTIAKFSLLQERTNLTDRKILVGGYFIRIWFLVA